MPEQRKPSRVVVLTGGPVLDAQVLRFVSCIEDEPAIDLVGIVSQSPVRGMRGMIVDLWRRRGLLAPAILLRNALTTMLTAVLTPASFVQRRRSLKRIRERLHFVNDIHAVETLQLIQKLEPVLGLVYGGPILRPELFSIPRLGTLGIHHGKVPRYRGKKTTFWAMYNGEPDVGVIIQKIGSNLDAGEIVMQANLTVGRRPLPRIRKQLDTIGLDLYLGAIAAVLDGSAIYVRQPATVSRLYKDPTATDIVRFWGRYLVRLIRSFDDT
jgi:folate-dependent phosphoribosylglycinamide formyltransferase PurN